MSRKRSTLQTQQRLPSCMNSEYRERGHANNNLWLVDSSKTRRDWKSKQANPTYKLHNFSRKSLPPMRQDESIDPSLTRI